MGLFINPFTPHTIKRERTYITSECSFPFAPTVSSIISFQNTKSTSSRNFGVYHLCPNVLAWLGMYLPMHTFISNCIKRFSPVTTVLCSCHVN